MKFTLRPWNINDLDNLVRYANNYKIAKNMSDGFPHPYTIEAGKAFIENMANNPNNLIFAIDINEEAVGAIGVHPQTDIHRKNAEMGYWLAEPFWGKGIISGAIKEIVEIAFKNFDINRIFARPFGSNLASQKVLEKAGFKLEARFEKTLIKNGELEDELVYAIRN
ncbi:MAG: GNAT family N-acetyltransferase [Bacteroidetes bacterium GWA2_31_9]|nr:MAG: GNAT family N-acetyltransferase [Bacteroidetes bacterium GWA2_31_9]